MSTINCTAELLPNGHLVLPKSIVDLLGIKTKTQRRIIILDENPPKKTLSQFCGQWQDDRDADDMVAQMREERENNRRSESFSL